VTLNPAAMVATRYIGKARKRSRVLYFGFLAPRTKIQTSAAVFALLGQKPRPRPPRQLWADSLKKHFGVDPLIDEFGQRLKWAGHRPPAPTLNTEVPRMVPTWLFLI